MRSKTVLITGGGSGLGKVAAAGLARMGAKVVIAVRDERRGAQALDELRAGGGRDVHLLAPTSPRWPRSDLPPRRSVSASGRWTC